MKKFFLIVAGGSGTRVGGEIPKQFVKIEGKPVLMYTLEIFNSFDREAEIILVLPESHFQTWKDLCLSTGFSIAHKLVAGGDTRFFSVQNGLKNISGEGIVFIHDGVRPCVSLETLNNCYFAAVEKGNAIPVVAVSESLRESDGSSSKTVDRSHYFLVQTPQAFQTELAKKAYCQNYSPLFTDDASVLEAAGGKINLVGGNRENIKITYPEDFVYAGIFLKKTNHLTAPAE